jgi:diguanylate cyclase (GGDEF)-like protein
VRRIRGRSRGLQIWAPLVLAIVLGFGAIAATATFEQRADASRRAQVSIGAMQNALGEVDTGAWDASKSIGGSPAEARGLMAAGKATFGSTLATLRRQSPVAPLGELAAPLREFYAASEQLYRGGSVRPYAAWVNPITVRQTTSLFSIIGLLGQAGHLYSQQATSARTVSTIVSAAATVLLLLSFVLLYVRAVRARARAERLRAHAERLAAENARLAALHRSDAVTDALTELPNRRALIEDIDAAVAAATVQQPMMLMLFDLDGFKQYNDSFGHAAGDGLLIRLSQALATACGDNATAYRMGGDEFCVVARDLEDDGQILQQAATAALSATGEGWSIGCSGGAVYLPREAADPGDALRLADVRMYAQKASRASAGRQTADALLCVLRERSPELDIHTNHVAVLARMTALAMGLEDREVREIVYAAELHDVGKAAIPDAILNKPGPLNAQEWELMQKHPAIGERIMQQAPALTAASKLVRASHERVDGTGYPDGLQGDEIPLGSRIIFACDAFDAMTQTRPYSDAISVHEAVAELRRCAGTQFDRDVVEGFCASLQMSELTTPLAS